MRLVYLSPVPWESYAQRPHKFVEWFHMQTGGEVLWLDPYPTRLPRFTDFRPSHSVIGYDPRIQHSWLQILRPFSLPIEPLPFSGWLSVCFWGKIFNDLNRFRECHETLVVIGKPSLLALAVVNRLKDVRSVYDAMDEFPAFYQGVSRIALAARERRLVRLVTELWVSSARLKNRWDRLRPDLRFVPNALDASNLPSPRNGIKSSDARVFGYVGSIAKWFDWGWIIALAKARPHDIIRLIGPVFNASSASLPENVELLPACHHEEALQAMLGFDVGLIPFISNELTASVDPIKFYEYRALGLPVISTRFGEMAFRKHEAGVFISESIQDIGALTESALRFQDNLEAVKKFVGRNSWDARFDAAMVFSAGTSL